VSSILFIFPGTPLDFNYSGAASRYAQNFFSLKELGVEIHVVRFHFSNQLQTVADFELASESAKAARKYAASWKEVNVPENRPTGKLDVLRRIVFDPVEFEFPGYRYLAKELAEALREINPDLIWAEYSDVAAAIWYLAPSVPWIYSSTDMRYLVRAIRNKNRFLLQSIVDLFRQKAEIKISRSANLVITGSSTEAGRLNKMGCRNVSVVPMISKDFPNIDLSAPAFVDLRVVHLGSLETTANRNGLSDYLSKAHPLVLKLCAENHCLGELVIIGDASRVKPELSRLLLQTGILLTGHVPDLSTVLRPYDIAILPYSQDSGYRTKLPVLMGYAQVIVATRSAVAGSLLPGLDKVCILLERVEDFPDKIAWLSAHPDERKRLGQAGRLFAEEHFSLDAVSHLYVNIFGEAFSRS